VTRIDWTPIAVAVSGALATLLAFFLFSRKDRAEIIARFIRIEKEVAELRKKGGDTQ